MSGEKNRRLRIKVLSELGASGQEQEELLGYNQNFFRKEPANLPTSFPLPSEPHVEIWKGYLEHSKGMDLFRVLQNKLVQLQFPIIEGISRSEDYLAATRRGVWLEEKRADEKLTLEGPGELKLVIHQTPAGEIPVLIPGTRSDFVRLVQSLTERNEPVPVPDSMGACIVAGFNNWDRIRAYRKRWEGDTEEHTDTEWNEEFRRLIPRKELYQDRFMVLSDDPYSNVPGEKLGLGENEWKKISVAIRFEHESTHYFTRRVFKSMHNLFHDELIADYMGIRAAIGRYRSDWFLYFMGLEDSRGYRRGGRLENYRGKPPLSQGAFKILCKLARLATSNVERFDAEYGAKIKGLSGKASTIMTLCRFTVEELASREAVDMLCSAFAQSGRNLF